jgi:hypothetical protein
VGVEGAGDEVVGVEDVGEGRVAAVFLNGLPVERPVTRPTTKPATAIASAATTAISATDIGRRADGVRIIS